MAEKPILKARPTIYNGIPMRSRLEARYAAWLDRVKVAWEYEPNCFADSTGQYLPDFMLSNVPILGSPRTVYVDVKPTLDTAAEVFRRMAIIWSTEPGAFLAVDAPPDLGAIAADSTVYIAFPPELGLTGQFQMNAMWCFGPPAWELTIVTNCTDGRWDYKH